MGPIVFLLCSILSLACTVLLYRGYSKSKFKLLFWCSVGFSGFALSNFLSLADALTGPNLDLSILRTIPSLVGVIFMIYGLIEESA